MPPGITLVLGGDGRGKTTLLRLLAGELAAQSGRLQLNDACLSDNPAAYRQQVFATNPRSDAFDPMTAIAYFKLQQGLHPEFNEPLLATLIDGLSLQPHLEKELFRLSTGSKRKVWLAAAFASGAVLTLIDEPFAALDQASIDFVLTHLRSVADHPARAWVISHYELPVDLPLAARIDLGD
ncbi:ABC transporter ATP-binding protein [Herbaspirillum sp. RTI4]|uniref:ABC transporter ATP-binding protein n=1 Tax=Herbaspirillum sp. RTI4 TaxID=3048640 RepID=UPI002B2393DA|nr:ATP-binding cassette domain-containing protein [Herbaspirillum sp. RTI4]